MQAWGPLVRLIEEEDAELERQNKVATVATVRTKLGAFFKCLEETSQWHRASYSIPDVNLRKQIREATIKLVVAVYSEFLSTNSKALSAKSYLSPESLQGLLGRVLDGNGRTADGGLNRRDSKDRNSISMRLDGERSNDFR
ncbi:hypothetical protein SLE2022_113810 [Rubroshorea leprosula]